VIGTLAQATSLVVSFGAVTTLACGLALFAGVLRTGSGRTARLARNAGAPETRP
jgi:hypothetical protein